MQPPSNSDFGIDRTVLLLFGGLVAVAFILIAAAGMRSNEERAQDAVNRDRDNRPNATAVEFGTNAEQVAP